MQIYFRKIPVYSVSRFETFKCQKTTFLRHTSEGSTYYRNNFSSKGPLSEISRGQGRLVGEKDACF